MNLAATNQQNAGRGASAGRGGMGAGFAFFVLLLISGIAIFWSGFFALFDAWVTPEYSHGPLIPVLSFYLFLRHLKADPNPPSVVTDRWPGVALIAFTLVIAMVGNLADIPDIVTYAMILWFYGLLIVTFGWRHGRQYWPPVLHLVFMLPLPAFIYWQVSINLQFISSEIGVALIRLLNIPVFLEGNVIDLGIYKLQVAEACSGLRYLFPVMSFSYIFAVLYRGPIWHKAVLLLSAAPITVLMNSFRIGMIGVMVDSYGIEQAEGFLHFFEGWVIFISCVLILFGLARLMQFIGGDKRPLSEALDLEFAGLGAEMMRVFRFRNSKALILSAALTAIVGFGWHLMPSREPVQVERSSFVLFPQKLDEWRSGPQQYLDPTIEAVLAADDYLSVGFIAPGERVPVDLFVAYYNSLTDGSGIHSPEVCIPTGGWEMSQITTEDVSVKLTGGDAIEVPVNRAFIQKGLSRQIVYYWFQQTGRRLTSDYVAKAATVVDALTRGRTDGALVRVLTSIRPGESDAAAEKRLQDFLGSMLGVLPRFVPD